MDVGDIVIGLPIALFMFVLIDRVINSVRPKVSFFKAQEIYLVGRFFRLWSVLAVALYLTEILSGVRTGKTLISGEAITWNWFLGQGLLLVVTIILGILAPVLMTSFHTYNLEDSLEKSALDLTGIKKGSEKLIDATDWEMLNVIKTKGGDWSVIAKESTKWIPLEEVIRRAKKLVLLRFAVPRRSELILTPEGMDVLNLPPILFRQSIEDANVLKKLAEIRLSLYQGNAYKVIVEGSRLLEYVLKKDITDKGCLSDDEYKDYNQRGLERATLGDLIRCARDKKLVDRFEDNVLSAIGEIRKGVHSQHDGSNDEITLDSAYNSFSLLEIFVKYHYSLRS